jgi:hypothetical protein
MLASHFLSPQARKFHTLLAGGATECSEHFYAVEGRRAFRAYDKTARRFCFSPHELEMGGGVMKHQSSKGVQSHSECEKCGLACLRGESHGKYIFPGQAPGHFINLMQFVIRFRFGERTRLGCWRRRPADVSEVLGETPRTACETQALPETTPIPTKPKQASGYRTQ